MKELQAIVKAVIARVAQIKDPVLGCGLLGGIVMCAFGRTQSDLFLSRFQSIAGVIFIFGAGGVYVRRGKGAPSSGQEAAVEKTVLKQVAADKKKRAATGTPNRRRRNPALPAPAAPPAIGG